MGGDDDDDAWDEGYAVPAHGRMESHLPHVVQR